MKLIHRTYLAGALDAPGRGDTLSPGVALVVVTDSPVHHPRRYAHPRP
ncbi:hypothetical protein C8N39_1058 [Dietzia psychralcaliphila]|nr:hypothetical protein C8N39_1058 [Dietzia psychralcaliphila]